MYKCIIEIVKEVFFMFKLKIPKDLVDVYYDGISLDVGDKLMIKYT